jgi:thiosulfate dehydrogenase [quinone] large subunit
MAALVTRRGQIVQDPPLVHRLLNTPAAGWLWLPFRVWLGWQWLESGYGKLLNFKWVGDGSALQGFWANAVKIPETGRPPISFDWYRSFLQTLIDTGAYTWFAKLVVVGELLVGIALVFGAFTGIAAFLGGFMNWNFMMAGSASVNPVFFIISVGLILAWKVSGWVGLDRVLLPAIGTPWGAVTQAPEAAPAITPTAEPVGTD